jgi:hypothetical protein
VCWETRVRGGRNKIDEDNALAKLNSHAYCPRSHVPTVPATSSELSANTNVFVTVTRTCLVLFSVSIDTLNMGKRQTSRVSCVPDEPVSAFGSPVLVTKVVFSSPQYTLG